MAILSCILYYEGLRLLGAVIANYRLFNPNLFIYKVRSQSMIGGLQIFGIIYLLFMMYLTFLYYKRNNYSIRSFVFWMSIWAVSIVLMIFPQSASVLTQQVLGVSRVIDFYLIMGLLFFSLITFINYRTVKKNEQKIEDLVRKIAIEKKEKKSKK